MSQVTEEQAKELVRLFGEEEAAKIIENPAAITEFLEAAGVAHKEKGGKGNVIADAAAAAEEDEEEDEDEEEAEEGETKEAKDIFELEVTEDLLTQVAAHVDVKSAVKTALEAMLPEALDAAMKAQQDAAAAQQETMVAAIKAAVDAANLKSKEAIVQQALAGTLRLTPYIASQADDNAMTAEQKAKHDAATAKDESPLAGLVESMMTRTGVTQ